MKVVLNLAVQRKLYLFSLMPHFQKNLISLFPLIRFLNFISLLIDDDLSTCLNLNEMAPFPAELQALLVQLAEIQILKAFPPDFLRIFCAPFPLAFPQKKYSLFFW